MRTLDRFLESDFMASEVQGDIEVPRLRRGLLPFALQLPDPLIAAHTIKMGLIGDMMVAVCKQDKPTFCCSLPTL